MMLVGAFFAGLLLGFGIALGAVNLWLGERKD